MSAPEVRRFALFWKPGSGKTGAMITAAHELLSREVVKSVLVVAERPLAIKTPWAAELALWLPGGQVENEVAAVSGSKQQTAGSLSVQSKVANCPLRPPGAVTNIRSGHGRNAMKE